MGKHAILTLDHTFSECLSADPFAGEKENGVGVFSGSCLTFGKKLKGVFTFFAGCFDQDLRDRPAESATDPRPLLRAHQPVDIIGRVFQLAPNAQTMLYQAGLYCTGGAALAKAGRSKPVPMADEQREFVKARDITKVSLRFHSYDDSEESEKHYFNDADDYCIDVYKARFQELSLVTFPADTQTSAHFSSLSRILKSDPETVLDRLGAMGFKGRMARRVMWCLEHDKKLKKFQKEYQEWRKQKKSGAVGIGEPGAREFAKEQGKGNEEIIRICASLKDSFTQQNNEFFDRQRTENAAILKALAAEISLPSA